MPGSYHSSYPIASTLQGRVGGSIPASTSTSWLMSLRTKIAASPHEVSMERISAVGKNYRTLGSAGGNMLYHAAGVALPTFIELTLN